MTVKFYKVGGCVRDIFFGRRSKDIDFAVEAPSFEAMENALKERGVEIFLSKPEFLTVRGKCPKNGAVDFVLCRKDGVYSDGRRPDSVEAGTLLDDLSRRDFTMNAMAEDEEGRLIDPLGGAQDIGNCVLRCVGKTEDRLGEDPLRMLRAIRFAIVYDLRMDLRLDRYLRSKNSGDLLRGVSVERQREELGKALEYDTLKTLDALQRFKKIRSALFESEVLWLKPTLEKKSKKGLDVPFSIGKYL